MKKSVFTLIAMISFNVAAQPHYWGSDRENDVIYPSITYVDSCPREKFPECPRKDNDYYTDFTALVFDRKIDQAIEMTALAREKQPVSGFDERAILTELRDLLININGEAIKKGQPLSRKEITEIALKDERVYAARTFNTIVRFFVMYDEELKLAEGRKYQRLMRIR